ncbi:DUF397 domain-containing protein [Kitasatospora sp. NPDC101801]|uniref:DUF397 domain-containing protein n=1 Tax=Kitasatospora sp. NPDC101801 TaxID=3364103 RepID=UPI0038026A6F
MPTVPDFSSASWFKARASESAQGCFEVAHTDGHVALRDTKDLTLPPQIYPADVWNSWLDNLRRGVLHGHRIVLTFSLTGVRVHDSADPNGQVHSYTHHEFRCFMSGVRLGEFDLAA